MKKLIYGALLLLAVPAFQSCIDDSESPSVTQQRQEKTEQIKALKELYQAQAYAERTLADAQKAYLAALQAESEAAAELAAVELERAKAELEAQKKEYENRILDAMLKAYKKKDAIFTELMTQYTTACSNLSTAQSNLINAQVRLAYAKANLTSAEMLNNQQVAEWEKKIVDNEQSIAQYEAFQTAYENTFEMTADEVAAAVDELTQEAFELTNQWNIAQVEQQPYLDELSDASTALATSPYSLGLQAFAGTNSIKIGQTTYYGPASGVNTMANFQKMTISVGVNGNNGQVPYYASSCFDSAYAGYYGYMMKTSDLNDFPPYSNYVFVPMFAFNAKATNDKLTSEEFPKVSVGVGSYSSWYTYLPDGFTSYLASLQVSTSQVEELYQKYQDALAAQANALTAVEEAQGRVDNAQADVDSFKATAAQLWAVYEAAVETAYAGNGNIYDYQTSLNNQIAEQQAIVAQYEPLAQRAADFYNYYKAQLAAAKTAAEKELLTAQMNDAQVAMNEAYTILNNANAAIKDLQAELQASQKANYDANVTAALKAYNMFVFGNEAGTPDETSVGTVLNKVLGDAQYSLSQAQSNYYMATLQVTDTLLAYQQASENASNGNAEYTKWSTVYNAIVGAEGKVEGLLEAYNEAAEANAEKYLVVSEYKYQLDLVKAEKSGYLADSSTAQGIFDLPAATSVTGTTVISPVTIVNVKEAIAICEANIAYYQTLIDNNTGNASYENIVAQAEADVALYEAQIKAYEAAVEAAQKALEDYLAE